MGGVRAWGRAVEDIIWPRRINCIFCGDPRRCLQDKGLCPDCLQALEEARVGGGVCPKCLCAVDKNKKCAFCRKGVLKDFAGTYAPFFYLPVTRALIHSVKFDGSEDALPLLTQAMAASLTDGDFDMMVPVPLHKKRMRERGFNQAALLARGVSALTGIPCGEGILQRPKETRQQSRLAPSARRGNVAGAFGAGDGAAGKKVLLVDDVRTTGCTAAACGDALFRAGAVKVSLLTACVVARPDREKKEKNGAAAFFTL